MIIFGFGGSKLTNRGAVWPATCRNCHNQVILEHVTTHASFRLFFIPIIPYDRKHYLICPVCRRGPQLTPAALPMIEQAKLLLARHRMGELTAEEYKAELARLSAAEPPAIEAGTPTQG